MDQLYPEASSILRLVPSAPTSTKVSVTRPPPHEREVPWRSGSEGGISELPNSGPEPSAWASAQTRARLQIHSVTSSVKLDVDDRLLGVDSEKSLQRSRRPHLGLRSVIARRSANLASALLPGRATSKAWCGGRGSPGQIEFGDFRKQGFGELRTSYEQPDIRLLMVLAHDLETAYVSTA